MKSKFETPEALHSAIFDAAAGYNVFLAELILLLVKNEALSKTELALLLVKQEMVNDHLPDASPARFAFEGLAEDIRDKLALPQRDATPIP